MAKIYKLSISILIAAFLLNSVFLPSVAQAKIDPQGNIVIEEQDIRTLQNDQQKKDEEARKNKLIAAGGIVIAVGIIGVLYKSQRKAFKPKCKKSSSNK